ncbi:MAG: aminopeptidase [Bacteriovoracaceae bacterium]|nr:aminopeptidase [Bacteriovoracaceae bacterium]
MHFIFLLLLNSCSLVSYSWNQMRGQLSIWSREEQVEKILKSSEFPEEKKEKLRQVLAAKEFFYHFFNHKKSSIYETYSQLNSPAVTYLLIATPLNSLKPMNFSFPIVGTFPYIGFFDLEDAKKKRTELEVNHFVFLRPVYAYSTLGYFSDPILSSFLQFEKMDLEELIFHELFHTIFFITSEVELNENLADFFAREMLKSYYVDFLNQRENWEKFEKRNEEDKVRRALYIKSAQQFDQILVEQNPANKIEATKLWEHFLSSIPDTALKKINNPAFLASYLTYQGKQNEIFSLYSHSHLKLRDFFTFIENSYYEFIRDKKNRLPYIEYLKTKMKTS